MKPKEKKSIFEEQKSENIDYIDTSSPHKFKKNVELDHLKEKFKSCSEVMIHLASVNPS